LPFSTAARLQIWTSPISFKFWRKWYSSLPCTKTTFVREFVQLFPRYKWLQRRPLFSFTHNIRLLPSETRSDGLQSLTLSRWVISLRSPPKLSTHAHFMWSRANQVIRGATSTFTHDVLKHKLTSWLVSSPIPLV
jgi:hypothetical protein